MSYHQNRGNNRRGNNYNRGNRHGGGPGKRGKDFEAAVDENNPVVMCFREYAQELDEKHDRYERIVKCSRDITIESKRIIFLLHTVDSKKGNQSKVCKEALSRLESLCRTHFCTIAKELQGLDPYQYLRAYTNGLQEFVEAYTFYEYIRNQNILHWKSIQRQLVYKLDPKEPNSEDEDQLEDETAPKIVTESDQTIEIQCLLPPLEFVLGVGDLTGEIMRKSINSLGSGDVESCFDHCRFMQELYKGFVSLGSVRSRDFSQKLFTLRQSLIKSENVCYNVKVRGGEAAKWGSTDDSMPKFNMDEDEGVFF